MLIEDRTLAYRLGWALLVGSAIILEILALRNKIIGDTLSETIWSLFDLSTGKFWAWVFVWFMTWFFVHIITRGRWA